MEYETNHVIQESEPRISKSETNLKFKFPNFTNIIHSRVFNFALWLFEFVSDLGFRASGFISRF